MAQLTLRLLGGFSVRLGSGPALSLGTKKAQALIAYLAVPPGRAHARDKLASLLWGDTGDEQARQSLRQTLVALRRALPATRPPVLVVDRDTLTLNAAAVDVDAQAFERLAAGATAKTLEQAVALYRGDLLEGVRVTEEPFEDWLRAERARLRERAVDALTRLLGHQSKAGETVRAVHTAARLLALDPLQEAVHRTLMRLHARQGRRGEALRQYQVCVSVLQRELRAEPEAETKHLYRELLQQTAPRRAIPDASPGRGTLDRAAAPAPDTPPPEGRLIGREVEMARLRQAWAAVRQGQGQVVVVVGEAGIGKSRLLAEVAAEAIQHGGRVLLGRCYESEQILPFGPWADALRTGRVIGDEALLGQLNPTWRAALALLLPEVAENGGPAPTGDRLRLFESVGHVVERLGATQPILLGLEDLHWADDMSLRLLAFVARRIRAAQVLIVATLREDEPGSAEVLRLTGDELGREPHCGSLALSPLTQADTAALVRTLARTEADEGAAAARDAQIWAISEGNPFVAVEAMRALQEGSMPTGSASTLCVPTRVREVITRRLERLSPQGQELAAVAAVIGREFEFGLLQRATGVTEREAAQGVEELVRRRVLHGVGERFDFTHDRIREAIAAGLLAPRQKVLHGQVATAIEELYAERLEPHATALGLHYLHAEAWDKASAYLLQAGAAARWRMAQREGAACLNQALLALEHLPRSRDTSERAVDIRLELDFALDPFPERGLILGHLREAERLAAELGDQPRLGNVLALLAGELSGRGDYDSSIDAGQRALAIGSALGDVVAKVRARCHLGRTHHFLGNFRRAKDVYQENVEELNRDPERQSRMFNYYGLTHVRLAWTLAELGEFARGLAYVEETAEICQARGNWWGVAFSLSAIGLVHLRRGALHAAIPALEQGISLCRLRDFPAVSPDFAWRLGHAYALAGRPVEGLPLIEESLRDAERFLNASAQSLRSVWLAEALLLAGRIDDAAATGQRALDLALQRREKGQQAYAQRLFGEIASHDGHRDVAAAERHYRLAASLAEDMGMRPLVAHCHFGLGKLYRIVGKQQTARKHLTTAATMYREMDMCFWPEQAAALASS